MKTLAIFQLFVCLTLYVNSSKGRLFIKTKNQSEQHFLGKIQKSLKTQSVIECSFECSHHKNSNGQCNAFSFEGDNCDLAQLTFLEDPSPSHGIARHFFFDLAENLPMKCRGGEGCCSGDNLNLCKLGDGDCNSDQDCAGPLVCGSKNCPIKTGGLWDPEDDCCELAQLRSVVPVLKATKNGYYLSILYL